MKTSNLRKVCMAEWDKEVASWATFDGCVGVWTRTIIWRIQGRNAYMHASDAMNGYRCFKKG